MRKRSGAIHSEDYDEYLRLSGVSQSQIGIFYNQNQTKPKTHNLVATKKSRSFQSALTFENFDFDRTAIPLVQEAKIISKRISTIVIMIILSESDQIEEIIRKAFQVQPNASITTNSNSEEKQRHYTRNVDLIIKNQELNETEQVIYKIWLNFNPELQIFKSYYKYISQYYVIHNLNNPNISFKRIQQLIKENNKMQYCKIHSINLSSKEALTTYLQTVAKKLLGGIVE